MSLWPFGMTKFAEVTGHDHGPKPEANLNGGIAIDAAGWLTGPLVERVPSVRHSDLSTSTREPIGCMWHYTATDVGTARNLARRIRTYDAKRDRAASWHVLVAYDGTLWQSISFERGAWHCGKGVVNGHRVNRCLVGIELEGHGDEYSGNQVAVAERILRALVVAYSWNRSMVSFEHRAFDPTRRDDPGDLWAKGILPPLVERIYRGT